VDLPAADHAMLEYADKLTHTPSATTVADVARLRAVGLNDRAIHDVCAIVAYFAFVNRIAEGLGVELEARSSQQAASRQPRASLRFQRSSVKLRSSQTSQQGVKDGHQKDSPAGG
jgi:hypothetical protein